MGKLDKLSKILKIGSAVGKPFLPGAAGSILDAVTKSIADEDDPQNVEGLKALAERCDEIEHAILILDERLDALEKQ